MNESLFYFIHQLAGKKSWLDGLMLGASRILPLILVGLVAGAWLVGVVKKDKMLRAYAGGTDRKSVV